ncbi:hypothetical protein [Legionella worsleiensis]|uniref:Leucine Rich repeats (2 copies) n=1 Tax=Legionella worsleiensis TaxID=45076 RepID=A0A0W1A3E3_9GAMM|nr:hypothetical protein [Legionella worsleiensis]KTD75900.1 Leucine Rich repeats (2 copies) [Legionella worsleiensis]STY32913.1 Leucine Rich repeats (2 copies) [Legionella worsleiensis]
MGIYFCFSDGQEYFLEGSEFDELWQLHRILGHQFDKNPHGLQVNYLGAVLKSRLPVDFANTDYDELTTMVTFDSSYPKPAQDFLTISSSKKFNPSYLYQQKSSETSWSRLPRGSLNVNRLIANLPCFTSPHTQAEEKKQNIVIHDFSARVWDSKRTVQVTQFANTLLQEGYPVYTPQGDKLIQVDSGEALVLLLKNNGIPYTEDEVILAAARQRIAQDTLHIIDYHELNVLLDGAEPDKKSLETGYWWHNLNRDDCESLLAYLNYHQKSFAFIRCRIFPDDVRMARELSDALHGIPIRWHYQEVNLSPGDLLDLVRLQSLQRRGAVLDSSHFAAVESLIVHHCNEELSIPDDFIGLLQHFTSLKCLSLEKAQNTTCLQSIPELAQLETLNLAGSDIDDHTLSAIISKSPKLKHLALEQCKNIDWNQLDYSIFAQLELLSIDSKVNLAALSKSTPKLNTLNLLIESKINNPTRLNTLKHLNIYGQPINAEDLFILIRKATSLESLTFVGIKNDLYSPVFLSALQELDLSQKDITCYCLSALLHEAPSLRALNLANCKRINGKITCGTLPELEKINLRGSNISINNVAIMLDNAPRLRTLDLSHCKQIYAEQTFNTIYELEEINLHGSNITTKTLVNLISCIPRVKTMDLSHCQKIAGDITCDNLIYLEKLVLSRSGINSSSLSNVLNKTPNLQILDLTGCYNIIEKITCKDLSELITLDLSSSTITSESLALLLSNTPKLQTLRLGGCNHINSEFTCGNLPMLETLILHNSKITPKSLENILNKAPNIRSLDLGYASQFTKETLPPTLKALLDKIQVTYPGTANEFVFNDYSDDWSDDPDDLTDLHPLSHTAHSSQPSQPITSAIETIDADTSETEITLHAQKIFYALTEGTKEPEVSSYRLAVFDELRVNDTPCSLKEAFFWVNNKGVLETIDYSRLPVSPANTPSIKTPTAILGIQKLTLDSDWQPLASLNPAEKLTAVYTEPVDACIEIKYSSDENLYFIRTPEASQNINIHFVLEHAKPHTVPALPEAIDHLHQKIKSYGRGKLELTGTHLNGKDYLNAICTQRKGACRHRAIAFKATMAELAPDLPVRIIRNQVHAFAEVCIEDYWLKLDFGGYPMNLCIEALQHPQSAAQPQTTDSQEQGAAIQQHPESTPTLQTTVNEVRLDEHGQISHEKPSQFHPSHYETLLATWIGNTPKQCSLLEYCQQKVYPHAPKQSLIELPSDKALTGLSNQLQIHCQNISRPVFYIHSPQDLVCQASTVCLKADGKTGEPCKGPSGALYEFLQRPCDVANPPILIVNYSTFAADDMVQFNALLDPERFADGIAVPKAAKIIGLINTQKPDRYTGSDFYSRFGGAVESCPVHSQELEQACIIPFADATSLSAETETTRINLFHAADWKERLLGVWRLQGNKLFFEEGVLGAALASGKPIILENAPVNVPDFQVFWRQALVQGYIHYPPGMLEISPSTRIHLQKGYNWSALIEGVRCDTRFEESGIVCNPTKVSELFRRFKCHKTKLHTLPGLLQEHQNNDVHLNITRNLSEDAWAECLSAAQKYQIRLHLHFPHSSLIPEFLTQYGHAAASSSSSSATSNMTSLPLPQWQLDTTVTTSVIISTDPDATIACVTQKEPGQWTVIDCSEYLASDLLDSLNGEFNQESMRFVFTQRNSPLIKALEEGKAIVLTGQFAPELVDELVELIIKRQHHPASGRLMIVTNASEPFACLPQFTHQVSAAEKRALLNLEHLYAIGGEVALATTPFAILKARKSFVHNHPGQHFSKA